MNIVVSIPVHEEPDVINNQIENFQKYIKNVIIVLHISKGFLEHHMVDEIGEHSGVYINPTHLDTKWASIIQTHLSNFRFICTQLQFDYFVLHASNDMYIRTGFEEYVSQYDAGFNIRKVINHNSHWWPGNLALKDSQLKKAMNACGQTMIIASQVESSFYKKDLMEKVVDIIETYYDATLDDLVYPREEIYFSTIASKLISWHRVGHVTTFSEVHRFDRVLWRLRDLTRQLYYHYGMKFICSENFYYKIENYYNDKLFQSTFYKTTTKTIKKLLENDTSYIKKNSYLNDGSGQFQLYGKELFSVKRINRKLSDPVRQFITNIP